MEEEAFRHEIISTICKLLFLRFFSNYFASGLGFQLEYESTNVSQWTFTRGTCGGSFTTQNGILTSPSYPDNYPDNADCIYTISQPIGTVIMLNFLSMAISGNRGSCINNQYYDNLEIRDGPSDDSPLLGKLCGNVIPAPIQSVQNQMWMR